MTLIVSGCETPQKIVPVSSTKAFRPIIWACEGPDAASGKAREGIIAHNSVLASLKTGKKTVYADHCPEAKPVS